MEPEPRASAQNFARMLTDILPAASAYAHSLVRNRADAEDALQQAALNGLQKFASFDPQRSFKAWWFTILRNCCLDLLRARRTGSGADVSTMPAPAPTHRMEDWEELAVALERLSDDHAEILRLRYFSAMSYQELSEALDIPAGTVMSRLHIARLKLADEMKRIRP